MKREIRRKTLSGGNRWVLHEGKIRCQTFAAFEPDSMIWPVISLLALYLKKTNTNVNLQELKITNSKQQSFMANAKGYP
jgi:hypothetical protein